MAKSIANGSLALSIDMTPVRNLDEALQLMQRARANAPAFCTNFFPAPARIQEWIESGALFHHEGDKSVLLFRKDRDFLHLHFAVPSPSALPEEIKPWATRPAPPLVADLIGSEKQLDGLPALFANSGFRSYEKLVRLSLPASRARELARSDARIEPGKPEDADALMALLESSFDRYAHQLPSRSEIEAMLSTGTVLVNRTQHELAAGLVFETTGVTSLVRFWVVGKKFNGAGLGSALLRHYLFLHPRVGRFILWVAESNTDAMAKYRHLGYQPDGLLDQVFVNQSVP